MTYPLAYLASLASIGHLVMGKPCRAVLRLLSATCAALTLLLVLGSAATRLGYQEPCEAEGAESQALFDYMPGPKGSPRRHRI